MKAARIRKDSYFDSVFLMSVSSDLKKRDGLDDAVVAMGTAMNVELLHDQGYPASVLDSAMPNDLIVAVDARDEVAVEAAFAALDELVNSGARSRAGSGSRLAATLDAALEVLPGANLAIISLPGIYAAREARNALDRGLHVMLFSDNVPIEEEIALKRKGREKGLLVMGPDCGTAIIGGVPLCFANVVRRGSVGIVAASGTGLQEVSCLLDRLGAGVSHAIGTGGRDLKDERVGGSTMLSGIEALAADPGTKVIVIVSKPPAEALATKILEALSDTGKSAVVHFVGRRDQGSSRGAQARRATAIHMTSSLEATATLAAELSGAAGSAARIFEGFDIEALAAHEASKLAPAQVFLRGYFTGGTVADEALFLLHGKVGGVWSNNQ
ncbi:MAG: FdrA family protein, partial [Spirochaetota bacterium]